MKYDESLRTPEVRLKEAEQIGAQLRTLRIARGMTQSDAAARAGVSRSTAVLLEQGGRKPHALAGPTLLARPGA
jgi:DNA-binding XRE family transcriptional regulator